MSPKKEVQFLNKLCVKTLTNELNLILLTNLKARKCCGDPEETLNTFLSQLKNAPIKILNDIVNSVITKTVPISSQCKYACLKCVLEQITEVNCTTIAEKYHLAILKCFSSLQRNYIQKLVLTGFNQTELLAPAIKQLIYLKTLLIPNMIDVETLEVISNLRCLCILDISGECIVNIPEKSLVELLHNPSLSVLSIGIINDVENVIPSLDAMSELLKNLPNLRSLKCYSFSGSAIQKLESMRHYGVIKLNLSAIRDRCTTVANMTAIVTFCPNLESLVLDRPVPECFKLLNKLHKLEYLKISMCIEEKELVTYLNHYGCNRLQALELDHVRLNFAKLRMQNLETLRCKEITNIHLFDKKLIMNLSEVELLSCHVSDAAVKIILSYCTWIRRLALSSETWIDDKDFLVIFERNRLSFLEELWLSTAKYLTVITLTRLINHCGRLKTIGQLSSWGVEREEIHCLRFEAALRNLEVELLYFPSLTYRR